MEYALHLGGGKPLGLGSCQVEAGDVTWWDAAGRYTGQEPTSEPAEEFVSRHRRQIGQLAGRAVLRGWPVLSRILRTDAVQAELLWYPLGGDRGDAVWRDRSFEFFARTGGRFLKNSTEPIVPLPDPAAGSRNPGQMLRLPPKTDRRR